jgi:hypothetical protein
MEQPKVETSALSQRQDTPRNNHLPLAPPPAPVSERRLQHRKDHTSGLIPNDITPSDGQALQPDFTTPQYGGPAPAWRRLFAGVADGVMVLMVMGALALPPLIGGYVWSLSQAGVLLVDGLPRLTSTPPAASPGWGIAASLGQVGGIERALELTRTLARADDQQPFLTLFAASAVAVLFALVTAIVQLVGATVVRGAPFWHRRLGLEIVETRTGYLLTWGRAVARWLAAALLWPLAPLGLSLDRRNLHDLLSGSQVRCKRR